MPALVFATTVASPSGAVIIGRYSVDSPSGATPSSTIRIGDTSTGTAYRCEMDIVDAIAVKQAIAELIADTTSAAGNRQKTHTAGSVEVIEPSDGGVIEVRSSPSRAFYVDRSADLADITTILDGIAAGALSS